MQGEELPAQDVGVGIEWIGNDAPPRPDTPPVAPSKRAFAVVALAIAALVGAYSLGQAGTPAPFTAPIAPAATSVPPTPAPTATATPEPEPPPELVDLLGQGSVLGELEIGSRSRAIIWCREAVPGTQIASTLALIHVSTSLQFGDQIVLYEELTTPWVPFGSARRGLTLQTEGLGGSNFAEPLDDEIDPANLPDGTQCESCAPQRVSLSGEDVLLGSCVHGVPFRAGLVYVIAPPRRPGQTPLALHVDCGITNASVQADELVLESEAPIVRGLYEGRFPLPTTRFERSGGHFIADDLQLLDWNCDVERSSQLADRHLLRTDAPRTIRFDEVDSAIGVIGVHGPLVLGLNPDQCSQLTRAWWDETGPEQPDGTPISDLIGLPPPPDERDWFYACG